MERFAVNVGNSFLVETLQKKTFDSVKNFKDFVESSQNVNSLQPRWTYAAQASIGQ